MGPKGLHEAGAELAKALEARKEVPASLLEEHMQSPLIGGLHLPEVHVHNHSVPNKIYKGFDLGKMPYRFYLVDGLNNGKFDVTVSCYHRYRW